MTAPDSATNDGATNDGSSVLGPLASLLPLVAARAGAACASRRPDAEVMRSLADAGLLRLMVPASYGGQEVHPHTFMAFVEAVARVDASTAWTAMTCNEEAGIASAYLEPATVTQLFSEHPSTIVAGSGVPRGSATPAGDSWDISGRWPFVSGCTAADVVVLASVVTGPPTDGRRALCFSLHRSPGHDAPHEQTPAGTPRMRIEDTWHTTGLRGSGSHDVVLESDRVAQAWAGEIAPFSLPKPDTAFYRLPSGLRFPFPKVGVAVGVARTAVEFFIELAEGKRPTYSKGSLANRPSAQMAIASAEAQLSSGRSWAYDMVEELWTTALADDEITPELHARCRLACSHAVASSIAAVDAVAAEAGSTAIFSEQPLAQLLADVHAVAAHFMVAPYQKATAGRMLLGLDAGDLNF